MRLRERKRERMKRREKWVRNEDDGATTTRRNVKGAQRIVLVDLLFGDIHSRLITDERMISLFDRSLFFYLSNNDTEEASRVRWS